MKKLIVLLFTVAWAAASWATPPNVNTRELNIPTVKTPNVNFNRYKFAPEKVKIVSVKASPDHEALYIKVQNIGNDTIPGGILQITLYNQTPGKLMKVQGSTKTNYAPIPVNQTFTYSCVYNPCYNGNALIIQLVNRDGLLSASKKINYDMHNVQVTRFRFEKVNNDRYRIIYKIANPTPFTVRMHVWGQAISTSGGSIEMYNRYFKINANNSRTDTYIIKTGNFTNAELLVKLPYPYNCGGSGEIELLKRTVNKSAAATNSH